MEKEITARYTVANITTKDLEFAKRADRLHALKKYTQEEIYAKGLDVVEKELGTEAV